MTEKRLRPPNPLRSVGHKRVRNCPMQEGLFLADRLALAK